GHAPGECRSPRWRRDRRSVWKDQRQRAGERYLTLVSSARLLRSGAPASSERFRKATQSARCEADEQDENDPGDRDMKFGIVGEQFADHDEEGAADDGAEAHAE